VRYSRSVTGMPADFSAWKKVTNIGILAGTGPDALHVPALHVPALHVPGHVPGHVSRTRACLIYYPAGQRSSERRRAWRNRLNRGLGR
jgi:hypothetical protein